MTQRFCFHRRVQPSLALIKKPCHSFVPGRNQRIQFHPSSLNALKQKFNLLFYDATLTHKKQKAQVKLYLDRWRKEFEITPETNWAA